MPLSFKSLGRAQVGLCLLCLGEHQCRTCGVIGYHFDEGLLFQETGEPQEEEGSLLRVLPRPLVHRVCR